MTDAEIAVTMLENTRSRDGIHQDAISRAIEAFFTDKDLPRNEARQARLARMLSWFYSRTEFTPSPAEIRTHLEGCWLEALQRCRERRE